MLVRNLFYAFHCLLSLLWISSVTNQEQLVFCQLMALLNAFKCLFEGEHYMYFRNFAIIFAFEVELKGNDSKCFVNRWGNG